MTCGLVCCSSYLGFYFAFVSSADFKKKINLFEKSFHEDHLSVNHSIKFRSGLIWVQSVCKSYQHTTLGDKELTYYIVSCHIFICTSVLKLMY